MSVPVADVYVDLSAPGCGSGTGTLVDPVCSINAAMGLASPGDTIRIAPGTYFETVAVTMDLDLVGTGGADVTIVDAGGAGSVITVPASVTLLIDGLTLTGGLALQGGGASVLGTALLTNTTITNNDTLTGGLGGGLFAGLGSSVTLEDCLVTYNRAHGDPFDSARDAGGGGLASLGGELNVLNSRIRSNEIRDDYYYCAERKGGAGISSEGGILTIVGSTISGNQSDCYGGGIWSRNFDGKATVTNSTISGNTAKYAGGGIFARYPGANFGRPAMQLEGVTVTANSGYGMWGYGEVHNSLIAGNIPPSPSSSTVGDIAGLITSSGYNLIGWVGTGFWSTYLTDFTDGVNGNQVGTFASQIDPILGPLQLNGGLTETHALLPGSPALDGGDSLQFEALDQRGRARPVGAGPDIGAVESAVPQQALCNGDGGDQLGCTNCPCANNAPAGTRGGCLSSVGKSARLSASGSTSISLPAGSSLDLRFSLEEAPPLSHAVLNSGSAIAQNNPTSPCFGLRSGAMSMAYDGLRCAVECTRRHGSRGVTSEGTVGIQNSPWGGEGNPIAGIANDFPGLLAGQTRYFQAVYRDDDLAGCMRGLNTTQAIQVTWTP